MTKAQRRAIQSYHSRLGERGLARLECSRATPIAT
jgi:hypothetical protein